MTRKPTRDRDAAETFDQLALEFPALLDLLKAKTMENVIYPHQKKAAALVVSKGMHVVDAPRRKA
jgi:hypothetical protein